jgi:hypothetical protein
MHGCAEVRKGLAGLAALRREELPPGVREHVEECPSCARALLARRAFQEALEALLLRRKGSV